MVRNFAKTQNHTIFNNKHNTHPVPYQYRQQSTNMMNADMTPEYDEGMDINPDEPIGDVDLEIVGLFGSNNGRSCCIHKQCGMAVKVGDVFRLKDTVVTINNKTEIAVKAVKISDGVEGCTVGFVPRIILQTPILARNINCFCVVKELYDQSESAFLRQKSHRNLGMAGVVLLNKIQRQE
jgi:hypothetical protein